jgi:hypothetical protein
LLALPDEYFGALIRLLQNRRHLLACDGAQNGLKLSSYLHGIAATKVLKLAGAFLQ